jgi:outer membrane protein OmpA-like peptidoglycan-associated protein
MDVMAQQIGKCTNYSGCKLAYRNEQISVVTKEFRCPECGSQLESVGGGKKSSSWIVIVTIGIVAVLLLAIGAIIWTLMTPRTPRVVVVEESSPTPYPTATPTPAPSTPATPIPTPISTPTTFPTAEVKPTSDAAPGTINLDVSLPEIDEVKRAVLKRIDLMPNLTKQNRDRLYSAVDKAHGLGRLFSVSFVTSNIKPTSQDVAFVKSQVEKPQVKQLLDDPTLVLVVLGYADKQGDDKRNLEISTGRAQEVSAVLKQAGVQNVIHEVPMGGTDIMDAKELAKNRVVEVWAVQP